MFDYVKAAMPLLAPSDPPAWSLYRAKGRAPALICVDHADNRVPASLGDLGLASETFEQHVAYDIGALAVSRLVADALDAPMIQTHYSRLVLDPNRYLDAASSIPERSDAVPIPGNLDLSDADKHARQEALFHPYQTKLADLLAELDEAHGVCVPLIAIHSFTPQLQDGGSPRPWHFGVIWDTDGRLSLATRTELQKTSPAPVGDNQPYDAHDPKSFTINHHGEEAGRPYVAIEIRQDLIGDQPGQKSHADQLAKALASVLSAGPYPRRKAHELGQVWRQQPQTATA